MHLTYKCDFYATSFWGLHPETPYWGAPFDSTVSRPPVCGVQKIP